MPSLVPLCVCLLLQASLENPGPVLRVLEGTVRLELGQRLRTLGARSGATRLDGVGEHLEVGALASLELRWRSRASATITGPAALALEGEPRLRLERIQTAEVEVRRGSLELERAGHGTLVLGTGVLRVRSLPAGGLEIRNRGANTLELTRGNEPRLEILPGRSLRLRARDEARPISRGPR